MPAFHRVCRIKNELLELPAPKQRRRLRVFLHGRGETRRKLTIKPGSSLSSGQRPSLTSAMQQA